MFYDPVDDEDTKLTLFESVIPNEAHSAVLLNSLLDRSVLEITFQLVLISYSFSKYASIINSLCLSFSNVVSEIMFGQ